MASLHIPIYQQVFDNGLRAVIVPNHKAPVVCLSVGYKVGSKDERRGKTGFAHLFEHLMFDGSTNVARGEYDAYLSAVGGQCNAYTAYDQTIYHEVIPSHQLELALWLESDRMAQCGVRQIGLETQQKVIIEEIGQTVEDQPYGRWREAQAAAAFAPECSYSWEVHGSKEDVAAATMDDVREFFGTFYRPDNACVVIAGDVQPDEALRLAERYFSDIPHGEGIIQRNQFSPEYRRSGYVRSTDNVPLAATVFSYHYSGMHDEDYLAGSVLASIAGDGRSAQIYEALIRRRQIASSVYVYPDVREHTSLLTFMVIAATPEISCEELSEALHQEISRMADEGISSRELGKARNSLTTSFAYTIQTAAGAADAVTAQTLFWNQPERVNSILDRYTALTEDKITDFMRETLRNDNCIRTDIIPA